jgi:hypothetical protein
MLDKMQLQASCVLLQHLRKHPHIPQPILFSGRHFQSDSRGTHVEQVLGEKLERNVQPALPLERLVHADDVRVPFEQLQHLIVQSTQTNVT